jgi:hypothetical protein
VPVKKDIEKITKIIPPPTIMAPAPMVMSDTSENTTLRYFSWKISLVTIS